MAIGSKNHKGVELDQTGDNAGENTTEDLGKIIFQFFNEVGIIQQLSSTMFNKRLPDGLHVSHFSILNHMTRLGDGKSPLALASAFQVTKGTMTHSLAVLSKRGFVRLEPHPTDGRSKVAYLTDEGRKFREQALQSLIPTIQAFGEKIDWKGVAQLLPELQHIRQVLDENREL